MSTEINVFISYSHKDAQIKQDLCKILENGGLTVLSDTMNEAGHELHKAISKLLNKAHFVVPIITENWLNSVETRDEFVRAHERRKILICLVDSESVDRKKLPFFVFEDLSINYTRDNINDKLQQVCDQIKNKNFSDFWKNSCYDDIRRLGDLIQQSNNLHDYKYTQFVKKISKLNSDLSNIVNDVYETNVSYEDNFLKDASPYFKFASNIHAVSIVNVSTFWTDRKAQNAAILYLEAQSDLDKNVIRLFVFETPRQIHYYKNILRKNFNYYVQAKSNNINLNSGVLVCSRKSYQKLLTDEINYYPISSNKIFDQDFGILTYDSALNKHSLEATLDSTDFKVKRIELSEENTRKSFVDLLNYIVSLKDTNLALSKYRVAILTGNIFENNSKWDSMVDSLFNDYNTSDIFHVIYFNINKNKQKSFETIIGKFISDIESKRTNEEIKFKSISLRRFKKIINARDYKTNGDLKFHGQFNYSLSIVFKNQQDLESYYNDSLHSEVREIIYVLLNNDTKRLFTKTRQKGIGVSDRKKIFAEIEDLVSNFIFRVDWEQYDINGTITPFKF